MTATRKKTGGTMRVSEGIAVFVVVGSLVLFSSGCQLPSRARPLPAISRDMAEGVVNTNASLVGGTLRAMGGVDGTVTDAEGVARSFSLDGVLFYLDPVYLRLDLKKFGDRQILLGSNAEQFWIYSKQDDRFRCGVHGFDEALPAEFPVEPRQLLDAFGLGPIADSAGGELIGRVQRIEDDVQQILFLVRNESGAVVVEKEYWLDRYAPRLIRRVLFRDADGSLEMESHLSNYRELGVGGPLLPFLIEANWVRAGAKLKFTVSKWSVHPGVGPSGPQFSTPSDCSTNGD